MGDQPLQNDANASELRSPSGPPTCAICGRTYSRIDHLERHLRSRKLPSEQHVVLAHASLSVGRLVGLPPCPQPPLTMPRIPPTEALQVAHQAPSGHTLTIFRLSDKALLMPCVQQGLRSRVSPDSEGDERVFAH